MDELQMGIVETHGSASRIINSIPKHQSSNMPSFLTI